MTPFLGSWSVCGSRSLRGGISGDAWARGLYAFWGIFEVENLVIEVLDMNFEVENLVIEVLDMNFEVENLVVEVLNMKSQVLDLAIAV